MPNLEPDLFSPIGLMTRALIETAPSNSFQLNLGIPIILKVFYIFLIYIFNKIP